MLPLIAVAGVAAVAAVAALRFRIAERTSGRTPPVEEATVRAV